MIGREAFRQCGGLRGDLIIPDTVTFCSDSALADCRGLNGRLTIGQGLTEISDGLFSNCQFTSRVEIPSQVIKINKNAFNGCRGFTEIVIGTGVTDIDERSFCSVHFLINANNINKEAFASSHITLIQYDRTNPPVCAFDAFDKDNVIPSVPSGYTSKEFCGIFFPTALFTLSYHLTSSDHFVSYHFPTSNQFTSSKSFHFESFLRRLSVLRDRSILMEFEMQAFTEQTCLETASLASQLSLLPLEQPLAFRSFSSMWLSS